ncbi:AMP-binding protein, partial [Massilia scottii]|uniref:AMP-binding protein n=1 Tax=Massilia scottii TaxID=3057166 RepID=UPI002796A4F2
ERFASHFQTLLAAMVADDTQAVSRLALLTREQRELVVRGFNATAVPYPDQACIHELFEARVAATPAALAALEEDAELGFGALNSQANRLARHLRGMGVGPDVRVALCFERSLDMLVGLLAVLKAGGAYVPLDPRLPRERLAYMVEDSSAVALLTHARVDASLRAHLGSLRPGGKPLAVADLGEATAWAGLAPENLARAGLGPGHLAYVMYTSGSTGQPKGVMIEHRGLCNQIAALQRRYALGATDRVLQFAAVAFDMGVEEIFGSLCSGAALVLRSDEWMSGAERFWELCGRHGVTVANLPTKFWEVLAGETHAAIPASLRHISIGGDAVGAAAIEAWFRRGGHLPRLVNAYGPTEATVNATLCDIVPGSALWQSIGKPMDNCTIYLLDAAGNPVPIGVAAEICIGGAGVA